MLSYGIRAEYQIFTAKKLHPYPLNLKFKVWNQGEQDGGYEHYLLFLEKREESRNFDVFLWREIW